MKKNNISGLGLSSFSISIIGFISTIINIIYAGTLPDNLPDESLQFVIIGLIMFVITFVSLIGLGLGISALFEKNKIKSFSIIGICINISNILINASFVVLGLITETV